MDPVLSGLSSAGRLLRRALDGIRVVLAGGLEEGLFGKGLSSTLLALPAERRHLPSCLELWPILPFQDYTLGFEVKRTF